MMPPSEDEESNKGHSVASLVVGRYEAWHSASFWFTLSFLGIVGLAGACFLTLHEPASPTLGVRKAFFAWFYAPLYALSFSIVAMTRRHVELNDVACKGAFVLIGSALTYMFLTVFNTIITSVLETTSAS